MEAKALVDLIFDEYPDLKFWVSFQCKVVEDEFVTNNFNIPSVLILSLTNLQLLNYFVKVIKI